MEASSTLLASIDQRKSSLMSRKPTKQKKKTATTATATTTAKNKPIKVRYISNPMKVKTCASKFREIVQELTGQDAVDLPSDPLDFTSTVSDHSFLPPYTAENPVVVEQEPLDHDGYYEPLDGEDEMLFPHMSAGFSGFYSNGFYNVNDFGTIDSI